MCCLKTLEIFFLLLQLLLDLIHHISGTSANPWSSFPTVPTHAISTVCVILFLLLLQVFPVHAVVRNLPVNTGDPRDLGLIPKSWNSPRRGNGNLFQYSCLENWWTEEPFGLYPSGMTEHACMHPFPSNLQVPFFTSPQIKKCQTRSVMSLQKTGLNVRRNWRDLHYPHFTEEKT